MSNDLIADQFQNPLKVDIAVNHGYGEFGWTATDGTDLYHLGDDYPVPAGTDVFAIANGTVIDVETGHERGDPGFGNYIIVEHTLPDGTKIYSLYAHLTDVNVQEGDDVYVDTDNPIGTTGNTGLTEGVTGNHLHFEISYENKFIGTGDFAGGYDDLNSPAWDGQTIDPSEFINEYANPGNVYRDFSPRQVDNAPIDRLPESAQDSSGLDNPRTETYDFDDLARFDTRKLTYDGFGYWMEISDNYSGLDFENFAALHTPSFSDKSTGYISGTTSGEWVAFNLGGRTSSLSAEDDFTLESGVFTAAWRDDLLVFVSGYDDGELVASDTLLLDKSEPTRYYFTDDFASIDTVEFYSGGDRGDQFALDDLVLELNTDVFI